jgi:hypothetical protein
VFESVTRVFDETRFRIPPIQETRENTPRVSQDRIFALFVFRESYNFRETREVGYIFGKLVEKRQISSKNTNFHKTHERG